VINDGDPVNVVVPTGNFGNILAAYYSHLMGIPVNMFICASNKNKVLTDFISTGTYDKNRDGDRTENKHPAQNRRDRLLIRSVIP
jgi:threonine synthase